MIHFRRILARMITLFVAANLVGFVVHGSKRIDAGFPCVMAERRDEGDYFPWEYYSDAVVINAAFAVGVSVTVAAACAVRRKGDPTP
jgi:hypothetical protein